MPPPKTTGQLIGAFMHVTHIGVKWASRSTAVPKEDPDDIWKSEIGWDYGEDEVKSWWSWVSVSLEQRCLGGLNIIRLVDADRFLITRSFRAEYAVHVHPNQNLSTPTS